MAQAPIIPASIAAPAQAHGRLPFGFTPRFLTALVLGLLWLIPAWWSARFVGAMFLWDAMLLAAWLVDLLRLPKPQDIKVQRDWPEALSLGYPSHPSLEVRNRSAVDIYGSLVDEITPVLRDRPPALDTAVPAHGSTQVAYQVLPRQRGDQPAGRVYFRYHSALGLAERWTAAALTQAVQVLPDIERAKELVLYLVRSRQVEMEKTRRRQRGMGREFDSLREHRQGDEMRDICWTATARRRALITRVYRAERSQAVWIVIDAGRLLRATVHDPRRGILVSKLDCAIDAALSLTQVALQSGDRVGLLAYGRQVQKAVGTGRGGAHLRTILNSLAQIKAETAEADHARAVRTLLRVQTQRALIVWITDFAETAITPDVIEHAALLTRRHLVMFAAMSQTDLGQLIHKVPENETEMFQQAAGLEVSVRRENLLRQLRQRGVLALDVAPAGLTDAVVNRYLEVKDRNQL